MKLLLPRAIPRLPIVRAFTACAATLPHKYDAPTALVKNIFSDLRVFQDAPSQLPLSSEGHSTEPCDDPLLDAPAARSDHCKFRGILIRKTIGRTMGGSMLLTVEATGSCPRDRGPPHLIRRYASAPLRSAPCSRRGQQHQSLSAAQHPSGHSRLRCRYPRPPEFSDHTRRTPPSATKTV